LTVICTAFHGSQHIGAPSSLRGETERESEIRLAARAALHVRKPTMNISRIAPTAARYLLGTLFFVSGLNAFVQFMPQPPVSGTAAVFMGALAATGYMFPLIKIVEVAGGAMLLSNRFVPLALALLAPNVVNIVAFHAFLAPSGLPVALVILILELVAAWSYRAAYAPMLRARTTTTTSTPSVETGAPSQAAL
jgi:uncharacterized membrane protein YphA (DoxX/SURF4 family)